MTVGPLNNTTISGALSASWNHYRATMVAEDGRPLVEPDKNDLDKDKDKTEQLTYSEAVAYTLLRAAIMDDKDTFDRVWTWTQQNLQRINLQQTWTRQGKKWVPQPVEAQFKDHLFAWRYFPTLNGPDQPGGVIDFVVEGGTGQRDIVAASDDIEIAAALYLASLRDWEGKEKYLEEARKILEDAWNKYVVKSGDNYYFFAGDRNFLSGEGGINPSYFRPAYFRNIFPMIDPSHPWQRVADSSYEIIIQSGKLTMYDDQKRTRPGANLPPAWISMNYQGELTENSFHPGTKGEFFDWDAFRTLWAVAQDYAWFDNPTAYQYLTDCQMGPLCFLQGKVKPGGPLTLFHHDGTPISYPAASTVPLYGGYLPYFHYAGYKEQAEGIRNQLLSPNFYHTYTGVGKDGKEEKRSYWGDPSHYYTQNWIWFGLMLTNYRLEDLGIKIPALPPAPEVPAEFLLPVDTNLGTREGVSFRAKLKRDLVEKNLDPEQIKCAVATVAESPYSSLYLECSPMTECFPQFEDIHRLDQNFNSRLFPYLADFREYWNNSIILLSVLSQKISENITSREEQIRAHLEAIDYCQGFRTRIEEQLLVQEELAPHTYSQVVLDLTEAELRARVPGQDAKFYREGIDLAASAINTMLEIDRGKAKPDYYIILRALMAIGDLYTQLHAGTQKVCRVDENDFFSLEDFYLTKASQFYNYVAGIDTGVNISAMTERISFTASHDMADAALSYNLGKGYLNSEEMVKAQTAIHYLRGAALAKNAALYARQPGKKDVDRLLQEIGNCNLAIMEMEKSTQGKNDFFISFARVAKADLLLALADRAKFDLWGDNSEAAKNQMNRIEGNLGLSAYFLPQSRQGMKLLELYDEIMKMAGDLYKNTPAEFAYLYASSRIKLTEIAIRNADFMEREFKYLLPLYKDPVIINNPIPSDEFLGIEINYLKAVLLVSSRRPENIVLAKQLLDKVIIDSGMLGEPYSAYFQVQAKLKKAVILSQAKKYSEAIALFQEIEPAAKRLEASSQEMAWRPYSFYAELYHEWAIALRSKAGLAAALPYARKALEMCSISDSQFDIVKRSYELKQDFYL